VALVQRSWCRPAQVELFGTVILKCPIRVQLFVEAFVRNIGPGNPLWNMGIDRLPLESFVRHIYISIPENYSQARFYANIVTILPLLRNLRSMYLVMRRWDNHIWEVQLGTFLPEHAPPSLERLCIQVSQCFNFQRENDIVLTIKFQIPAGDPDALSFARRPGTNRWRDWFGAWRYIRTLAFVCEDIWWHRSPDMSKSEASQAAESIVREWLVDTSLERFELWSGADEIRLSPQLQIEYGRFHNLHSTDSTRHRYSFRRDEDTNMWMLSSPTVPMHSAVSQFREHICIDGCWICLAMEDDDNLERVLSYLDDVREEDWHDRILEMTPWSMQDCDPSYKLSM
jgi:hypothetical protein